MYDIGGHITNLFEELPCHLSTEDKGLFGDIIATYENKETKRNCDHRKALLLIANALNYKLQNQRVISLLKTLVEIQRILYSNEEVRTPKEILRLHNSCFQHFILMKEVIGFDLHKITREKLYGKYSHNLLVPAPI